MNTKLLMLIFILVIIAIVLAIVRSNTSQKSSNTPSSKPVIQMQDTLDKKTDSSFTLASNYPSDKLFKVTDPLVLTFSKPVDESSIFIGVKPETTISATFDSSKKVLTISPIQTWVYATSYNITVSKDARSIDGFSLSEDKKFTFQTANYSGI